MKLLRTQIFFVALVSAVVIAFQGCGTPFQGAAGKKPAYQSVGTPDIHTPVDENGNAVDENAIPGGIADLPRGVPFDGGSVLILYNSDLSDSVQVAQYYALHRNVPSENLLGISGGDGGGVADLAELQQKILGPLRQKLTALGKTKIKYILLSYMLPVSAPGAPSTDSTRGSLDSLVAAPFFYTSTSGSVSLISNPYLEPNPGFQTDRGSFDHASTMLNGEPTYLVNRIDGPGGLYRMLNLVDLATYAHRFVGPAKGHFGGKAYVDSRALAGGTYADQELADRIEVQSGSWSGYVAADLNIAYVKKFLTDFGIPFEWEGSDLIIGRPNARYQSGVPATAAEKVILYGGWYAYNSYLSGVWDWQPGAVAADLNSTSLAWNIRHAQYAWGTNAIENGVTAVCGVVGEPYTTGHPRPSTLIWGLISGRTFGEASSMSTPFFGWQGTCVGDPLYAPYDRQKPVVVDNLPPRFEVGYPKVITGPFDGVTIESVTSFAKEPKVVRVKVEYGHDGTFSSVAESRLWGRRHQIRLNDLLPAKDYRYRVTITDLAGRSLRSAVRIFKTNPRVPFESRPAQIPGVVLSKNFDEGGNGVAFWKLRNTVIAGWAPRVETGAGVVHYDPYFVTQLYPTEWLSYTIRATSTKEYSISLRTYGPGGKVRIFIDGKDIFGAVDIRNGQNIITALGAVNLIEGTHQVRFFVESGSGDLGLFSDFYSLEFQ